MHPTNKNCFDLSNLADMMPPAPAAHSPDKTVPDKSPPDSVPGPAAGSAPSAELGDKDAMDTSDFVGSGSAN